MLTKSITESNAKIRLEKYSPRKEKEKEKQKEKEKIKIKIIEHIFENFSSPITKDFYKNDKL